MWKSANNTFPWSKVYEIAAELCASSLLFTFRENVRANNCCYYGKKHKGTHFFYFPLELAQLTGVAAVLRFPMPELEDEPLDSDEESD